MKWNIYTIHDSKTRTYNTPFFQPADPAAIRMFKNEVNRADDRNNIYLNPEDFTLFRVGTFDIDTGETTGDEHTQIATATSLKADK